MTRRVHGYGTLNLSAIRLDPDLFLDQERWGRRYEDDPFGPELIWWGQGRDVIGIDEAGRGPVAGPVVAAAVAFDPSVRIEGIGDSKKISPRRREELDGVIRRIALAWAVAEVDHARIDKINILQATREAMAEAAGIVAEKLNLDNPGILVDGRIPPLGVGEQVNIIRGDSRSFSIGAASIIAKVYRDRLMNDLDKIYPGYELSQNKGYGTRRHIEAIKRLGYSPIHRCSFRIKALEDMSLNKR